MGYVFLALERFGTSKRSSAVEIDHNRVLKKVSDSLGVYKERDNLLLLHLLLYLVAVC